jgi:lipoyl(octanoyl) transferase
LKLGVRDLVTLIEQSLVATLAGYGITANARPDAPGVYVDGAKIASLGLRVRRGCSFHGLSLNVDMEMNPFLRINPCGYQGLAMTQMSDLVPAAVSCTDVEDQLVAQIAQKLGYESCTMSGS